MRRLTDVPRPATGKTPVHNFRASPELWDEAVTIAAERGETMTDVLVQALEAYVKRHRKTPGAGRAGVAPIKRAMRRPPAKPAGGQGETPPAST